jgi:hypothetical protein
MAATKSKSPPRSHGGTEKIKKMGLREGASHALDLQQADGFAHAAITEATEGTESSVSLSLADREDISGFAKPRPPYFRALRSLSGRGHGKQQLHFAG